jgi:hypothetical protein
MIFLLLIGTRPPSQQSSFDESEDAGRKGPEESKNNDAGVKVCAPERAGGQEDVVSQTWFRRKHLRNNRENQGESDADACTREYVRHSVRQRNFAKGFDRSKFEVSGYFV